MFAFNNYCTVCDKLIPHDTTKKDISRSSSISSNKSTDKLYCSNNCRQKDKLHIIENTITASQDIMNDEMSQNCLDHKYPVTIDSILDSDNYISAVPSPILTSSTSSDDSHEIPGLTITTVTDDMTSKTTLDEKERLLASPLLSPINSNGNRNTAIDDNISLKDNFVSYYYDLIPLRTIYNIPKNLFIGSLKKNDFENCSFEHIAENNYKVWLSNNIPYGQ